MKIQKITPFLWFDSNAEEAVQFYTSVFKNSKTGRIARYTEVGPGPKGSVMTIDFEIEGQEFIALNGGPHFKFNEAVSFVVNCETQEEIDHYWEKLTADGGEAVKCGWLTDKFGVSWQVTPTILPQLVAEGDAAKANRVMKAMLEMVKLDVAKLKQAAAEK